MQLGRGENERALRHFAVYLDTAPAGPLAEEAMQGKAEALHRLRRFGEERQSGRSYCGLFRIRSTRRRDGSGWVKEPLGPHTPWGLGLGVAAALGWRCSRRGCVAAGSSRDPFGGGGRRSTGVRRLLTEWLGAGGRQVEMQRVASLKPESVLERSAERGTLRVWVVLATSERALLYFADPASQQFLVREVPLRNALDELGREQIAQILVASLQAFVEHHTSSTPEECVGPCRSSASPAAAIAPRTGRQQRRQPSPRESRRARRFPLAGARSSGALCGEAQGPRGHRPRPGSLLGVARAASRVRWDLAAKAQYELPTEGRGQRIVVSTQAIAFRLAALAESRVGHHFAWGAELGGGFDYVTFSPRPSAGVLPRPGGSDLRPVAVTALRGSIGFPDWRLSLTAGITTVLVERHYDLVVSGKPERDWFRGAFSLPWESRRHGLDESIHFSSEEPLAD